MATRSGSVGSGQVTACRWVVLLACLVWGGGRAGHAQAVDGVDASDEVTAPARPRARGVFQTTVRLPRPPPADAMSIAGETARTLPGALGDPLRILALLPGVASPLPGLPLYAVRGASPGTSGFFLDGMRLPELFHLLVGGGVVHAELVDQVDFLPSGYDARFGRAAGGIVSASTRPARTDGQHFEAQLRVFDVAGLLELKLPWGVRITASGHYGYPGPILSAIDSRISLDYWDYQFRLDWRWLTVQVLGAFDALELGSGNTASEDERISAQSTRILFHRVQVRARPMLGPVQLDAALVLGLDEAGDRSGRGVHKKFASARAQLHLKRTWLSLFAGADAELSYFSSENFELSLRKLRFIYDLEGPARTSSTGTDGNLDELGDLGGNRLGVVGGAFVHSELTFLDRRVQVHMGARLDVYHSDGVTLIGVDPRMQLQVRPTDWLTLRLSGGLYQQPPLFPLLLPGIDTFALKLGLQRSTGAALTQEVKLPLGFVALATGYTQRFHNFTDMPPIGVRTCAAPPPASLRGTAATLVRVTDGQAYGMELMLRRQTGRISGWLAYTLSRSERELPCGLRPADYDQTHILNAVVQVRLPAKIDLGLRFYVASGRPDTIDEGPIWRDERLAVRNNVRLPTFFELDVRLDKTWVFRRFFLSAFVEVVNATFSRTVFYLNAEDADMQGAGGARSPADREVGFRWLLPSLGLRGGF